ncbi:unnamed protein product [Peronospora belbahrii]|uniref:Amine oxidase domain-containing protein n=1 Tax=Peronospora belbahrii TaxID=622444 RepID=A0AAU9KH15_9STRA|nr:unnamed protein product [Peronospora belbahrii]CAH0515255.1 unnamed protein product [Peronospora belbahrii]
MKKTLIIGGGMTGAALARLLHEAQISAQYVSHIVIWDRNSIFGGRAMARSLVKQRDVYVDMGAQYWTPQSEMNTDLCQNMIQSGQLVPFAEKEIAQDPYRGIAKAHFICSDRKGFRHVVEYLLEETQARLSTHLESFKVLDANQIQVKTSKGEKEIVNELVLTCPIPNVLSILKKSTTFHVAPNILQALEDVKYSQRFAAAYVFDNTASLAVQEFGWTAKYVSRDESDIIRFLCWDHLKKHTGGQFPPTLIVHTSVSFGATFMDDSRPNNEILAIITKSLQQMLPSLPTEHDARLHRWRISQVIKPYHDPSIDKGETEKVPALLLSTNPRIIIAGDSFLGSKLDNCLISANAAAKLLQGI